MRFINNLGADTQRRLTQTTVEAASVMTGKIYAGKLATLIGTESGNANDWLPLDRKINEATGESTLTMMTHSKFARRLLRSVTVAPVLEEAVFRLAPSVLASTLLRQKGNAWPVGLGASIMFARAHGTRNDEGDRVWPIQQFAGGMFYWGLTRRRGFSHAVYAHALNNSLALIEKIQEYKALEKNLPDLLNANPESDQEIPGVVG